MEIIKKEPYKYICNWVEELLPHTGKQAFEVISLMPCSLILPDLDYKGKKIRSNINVLLLTASGGGKSTIAKELAYLSYNSIDIRSVTPAKLEAKITASPLFTFIVEDFSTMSKDPVIIKVVEGILGEEKRVQRATMHKDIDINTDGIGLLCGVPQDLSNYLSSGLIFRIIPICIFHSEEEHSNIGREIMDGIGEDLSYDKKEQEIKDYYYELFKVQIGEHPELSPIIGYHIEDKFKKDAYEMWDRYTREILKKTKAPLNWFRSLHEFLRILVSHAFLNVFNRKVENGILYPNEEDYKVAINLMKQDLKTKYKLISTEIFIRHITSLKELARVMNSEKISEEQKKIIQSLVKIKKGRIVR